MFKRKIYVVSVLVSICLWIAGCKVPAINQSSVQRPVPETFGDNTDTVNTAQLDWRHFFTDEKLAALIDTALKNNQELLITLQEIEIARNDIRFKEGALLPAVRAGGEIGVEKVGRYTSQGAGDASTEIKEGKKVPDPLMDYTLAVSATWELDIWKKLHNAKKAAVNRYLSTVEGKNFLITNLVAEVASSYYELLALDNELAIVTQTIELQRNALEIVKVQKEAAKQTELAVQKFQAEVFRTEAMQFSLRQQIREVENKINLLLGRYAQPVPRDNNTFLQLQPSLVKSGIPSQLLINRPDIRQAEWELAAARLDVKVARAEFYPSLGISAAFGAQAFSPSYLVKLPESILYSLAGEMAGPLINKKAITAEFNNANARQRQALYKYERSVLTAYLEVSTYLSSISNLEKMYAVRVSQVDALTRSIEVANDLFKSARADYFEVLMTQRDALETKMELVETKKEQMLAMVGIYKGLGGGWR